MVEARGRPNARSRIARAAGAWVDQVYRPGYGHLAATLAPCWTSHDLCLYALDILSDLWSVLYLQPERTPPDAVRPGRVPGPHPARPGRPADDLNLPLRPHPAPPAEDAMTDATLRQALAYARHGWPVFPCLPARRSPPPAHGFRDATTDEQQITKWFGRGFAWNLAIATGAPGPDVLDIDQHGEAGNGYPAFGKLRRAGLADGAAAYVRTPAGRMHAYFTGSDQRNGRLPSHHLDFRSQGGYILAPPSQIGGKSYYLIKKLDGRSSLDWAAVTRLLEPQRQQQPPPPTRPRTGPRPAGPLGRQPARRQPQLRPVLGRQPRARRRPRRRPEPPGRRRPPSRPRRTGDHPHPRLRPQDKATRPRR